MSTKIVKCNVCDENEAKYKCPRCSMQTCCLQCCNQHKKVKGCNGQRDKTAYIPMKEYSDGQLLSDYRLLEEMDRSLWRYQGNEIVNRKYRSHFHVRLLKEARQRGIQLRLLPDGFKKRKINSTIYVFSKKSIYWHLEWQFPKVQQEVSMIKIPENKIIGEELKTYLNSMTTSHLLWKNYRDNFDQLSLLVKVEETKMGKSLYWRADPSKTVTENLKGHVVVEYPTILVVTKDELPGYRIEGEENISDSSEDESSDDEEPPCKRPKDDDANETSGCDKDSVESTQKITEQPQNDLTEKDNENNAMKDNDIIVDQNSVESLPIHSKETVGKQTHSVEENDMGKVAGMAAMDMAEKDNEGNMVTNIETVATRISEEGTTKGKDLLPSEVKTGCKTKNSEGD